MTRRFRILGWLPATCVAIALSIAGVASVAYAATLAVTSARVTTSTIAASVPESTCTLAPQADTSLDRNSQNSNFGGSTALWVRAQNGPRQKRTLLSFDVASCGIPSGALLVSSTLQMKMTSATGANRIYGVHRVTEAWGEFTATYANQPTFTSTASATVNTGTTVATLSWSVMSDVDAFIKGTATNSGWLVKDADEGTNPPVESIFGSRENATANRPTLVIGYYP